jgi:hypothetical protein
MLGKLGAWLLMIFLFAGAIASIAILPSLTMSSGISGWLLMPLSLLICAIICLGALLKDKPLLAYGSLFAGICSALTAFSLQIAPAMAKQAPALEYLQIIKQHPEAKIALHSDFAKTIDWYDCTLFETGRAPEQLSTETELERFLMQGAPALVILPKSTYDQLSESVRSHCKVEESEPYMSEKLDLGFFIKGHGKLTGEVPLLLVSNQRAGK